MDRLSFSSIDIFDQTTRSGGSLIDTSAEMSGPFSYLRLPQVFFSNPYLATCFPVVLGGLIGYQSGTRAREIYADLKQPPLKPSPKAFGPVWTTVYAATGFASYLARGNPVAQTLYTTSLVLNFGESIRPCLRE